jgi:formylglycine-generating enzyme required for sulfatase activity
VAIAGPDMNLKSFLICLGLGLAGATTQADDAAALPHDLTLDCGSGVSLKLVLIPAGTFLMGSPDDDKFSHPNEKPQHQVTISRPFYFSIYPVTQEQYDAVMGPDSNANPGQNSAVIIGPNYPEQPMSYGAITAFLQALSQKTGKVARLNTEAEWEYACRAGTQTPWFYGTSDSGGDDYGWFKVDADGKHPKPVGQKKPNPWGLYDMLANVMQVCSDLGTGFPYTPQPDYTAAPATDPTGPTGSDLTGHVTRGSVVGWAGHSRSAGDRQIFTDPSSPERFFGFRVVVETGVAPIPTPAPPPIPVTPTPVVIATNAPPVPEDHPVATVKLTQDQARAIVLVQGDNSEGTGFLIKTKDGPVVVTNIHVISNNPNLKITTNSGTQLTIVSIQGATDRDLAEIAIKDGDYQYLELATDVSGTVQPGDEVITPGNSEGGEVVLNTDGKVLGIGPNRIEFDNPIYHGNSGGPVFHAKSGKVIGVVTEAMKVDLSNALDKASFANRNSAIGSSMRYFGLRLDTVPSWETLEPRRFQNETAFLDQFDHRTRCLDCYLNAPDDNKPEDLLWRDDKDILKHNDEFLSQSQGADISQRLDAVRIMWSEFNDTANTDMDAIGNPNNFYSFDRIRAADEAAYRKAIQAELNAINDDVSRMGSLPRSNNSEN